MFIEKYEDQKVINYIALPGLLNDFKMDLKRETLTKDLRLLFQEVCIEMSLNVHDTLRKNRKREYVFARQSFCYLAKKYTKKSLVCIGESIERDHTTVIHGINTINDLMCTDIDIKENIERLEGKIFNCQSEEITYETIKLRSQKVDAVS